MRTVLKKVPYSILIPLALILLLAPVRPMPHVVEKLMLLKSGELQRPIDIFDLFYHLAPLLAMLLKLFMDITER
jgi:hypothetical protein